MPPPTWTSAEQDEFIKDAEFYNTYMRCQAERDYSSFWPPFFEKWFHTYPEWRVMFPEIPDVTQLSSDQRMLVADAVEGRKKVSKCIPEARTVLLTCR